MTCWLRSPASDSNSRAPSIPDPRLDRCVPGSLGSPDPQARLLRTAAPILNAIGLGALLLPLLSLGTFFLRAGTDDGRAARIPAVVLRPPAAEPAPDIYYIILDGYSRSDYMADPIGLDNSAFIHFLEGQGFYVAGAARSNHNWTSLSLASSLNMTLAQHLGANMLPGYYPTPFINFIRNSLVSRSLQEIGYHTIGLQSGYLPTEWVEADAYLGPATDALPSLAAGFQPNAFETMLLDTTILGPVVGRLSLELEDAPTRNESYPHEVLRSIILSAFDRLARPLPLDGPRLVFAHIVAPHRPYLFTATGEAIDRAGRSRCWRSRRQAPTPAGYTAIRPPMSPPAPRR